uniref:Uncharacterized protein n=1 Tax=Triticum urartu TaxID=4572 RepID=A0A8R7QGA7_TRIUA
MSHATKPWDLSHPGPFKSNRSNKQAGLPVVAPHCHSLRDTAPSIAGSSSHHHHFKCKASHTLSQSSAPHHSASCSLGTCIGFAAHSHIPINPQARKMKVKAHAIAHPCDLYFCSRFDVLECLNG